MASCSNNGDSNAPSNPSPTLPSSVGDNPVSKIVGENSTKEIKLQKGDQHEFLGLKTDDTALYYYGDENSPSEDDYLAYEYKYTWNTDKKEIYVAVRKSTVLDDLFCDNIGPLDYEAAVSKLNSFSEKDLKKIYEVDEEYWNEKYNCENYKDYIDKRCAKEDCENVAELIKKINEEGHVYLERIYKAITTFGYEIKDGKMTISEKFTGIKNIVQSKCVYNYKGSHSEWSIYISCYGVEMGAGSGWSGPSDSSSDADEAAPSIYKISEKIQKGDYTENIEAETVAMKIDGKELVFKFKGETFTQVSE